MTSLPLQETLWHHAIQQVPRTRVQWGVVHPLKGKRGYGPIQGGSSCYIGQQTGTGIEVWGQTDVVTLNPVAGMGCITLTWLRQSSRAGLSSKSVLYMHSLSLELINCQLVFHSLKEAPIEAPILPYPRFTSSTTPFGLQTRPSVFGLIPL